MLHRWVMRLTVFGLKKFFFFYMKLEIVDLIFLYVLFHIMSASQKKFLRKRKQYKQQISFILCYVKLKLASVIITLIKYFLLFIKQTIACSFMCVCCAALQLFAGKKDFWQWSTQTWSESDPLSVCLKSFISPQHWLWMRPGLSNSSALVFQTGSTLWLQEVEIS